LEKIFREKTIPWRKNFGEKISGKKIRGGGNLGKTFFEKKFVRRKNI